MDESPHRGGRFVENGSRVFNQSYLFSPAGLCLQRTRKANIPPGEDFLIDSDPQAGPAPAQTAVGPIGTVLCFDGYHHSVIERADASGTDILVQPLYFPNPDIRFDGSGKIVPSPWDFIALIQGRENIRYGIAAAQVGAVFADQRAEGLSFIAQNTGVAGTPWQDAVVAMAVGPYEEAIVSATVDTGRQ
jgi:predicted amidohydrolase